MTAAPTAITQEPATASTATPALVKKPAAARVYIILCETNDGGWRPAGTAKATSSREAIRQAAVGEGVYVAVPDRSWQPVTVAVETSTRVTLT